MNLDSKDYDCWVFPCVNNRAQSVFFTVAAPKDKYLWSDIFDDVVAWLKAEHGLTYIGDGSAWGRAGESEFEFWPPGEK